jgi:hypothetical protein
MIENKKAILEKVYISNHEVREKFFLSEENWEGRGSEVFSVRFYSGFLKVINEFTDELGLSRYQLIIAALYRFLQEEGLLNKLNNKT